MYKIITAFSLLTTISCLTASPVQAGWLQDAGRKIDHTNRNSDVRSGAREIDPTNKNSAVREAGRQLDESIREGIESATRICQEVGPQNCLDPNFQSTYLGLKLAENTRVITGTDSCGGLVHTAVEGGGKEVQAYALYNGVPVPPELLQLGKQKYNDWGLVSCKIIYGSFPESQNLARTTIDDVTAIVPKSELPKVREFNNQIENANQPVRNSDLNSSPSQGNSTEVDSGQKTDLINEEKQENFRVVW